MTDAKQKDVEGSEDSTSFRLMISHATVDAPLAQAWDLLLRTIFSGATTWFSTKRDAFSPEDNKGFAARIEEEIRSANFLLTIQTPNSRLRPWLVWEAALAVGAKIPTFVVLYSIKPGQTGNPLDGMHQYSQDRDNGEKDGWGSAN